MCFVIGICVSICVSMLLNNARICLNLPEIESKKMCKLSSIYRYIFIDTYLESYQTSKMV